MLFSRRAVLASACHANRYALRKLRGMPINTRSLSESAQDGIAPQLQRCQPRVPSESHTTIAHHDNDMTVSRRRSIDNRNSDALRCTTISATTPPSAGLALTTGVISFSSLVPTAPLRRRHSIPMHLTAGDGSDIPTVSCVTSRAATSAADEKHDDGDSTTRFMPDSKDSISSAEQTLEEGDDLRDDISAQGRILSGEDYTSGHPAIESLSIQDSVDNPSSGTGMDEVVYEEDCPLSYQIPPDTLRSAMTASPSSDGSFYSHTMYRGPEDQRVAVHYCHTKEIADRVSNYFAAEAVVGIDIEWKPAGIRTLIKENVSLIQIACNDRIALFHIALFEGNTAEELLPSGLRSIMESHNIYKTGVGIQADFRRLQTYLGITPRGVFELSRLHNLVEFSGIDDKKASEKRLYGLAKQVHQHLQLPMSKGLVRTSDWSQRLNIEQISYAATDVYASYRLFYALNAKRKALRPVPPLPDLCNFEVDPRPRYDRSTRHLSMRSNVQDEDEAEGTTMFNEQDESEGYETAPEVMDSPEVDDVSDSDLSDYSLGKDEEPDAEYIPRPRKDCRAQDALEAGDTPSRNTRQLRRVELSKGPTWEPVDPGYPILPQVTAATQGWAMPDQLARHGRPIESQDREWNDGSVNSACDLNAQGFLYSSPRIEDDTAIAQQQSEKNAEERASSLARSTELEHTEVDTPTTSDKTWQSNQENIAIEAGTLARQSHAYMKARSPTASVSVQSDKSNQSPEYISAESWARSYLQGSIPSPSATLLSSTPSRVRASGSHLRAYHLWHEQGLDIKTAAKHMRNPPLALSTVAGYIVQAVITERLSYVDKHNSEERFKEVLGTLPMPLRIGKYKWLVDQVGAS